MRALNRKLIRDLWKLKAQALAIALVIAGGMATWVISLTTMDSLQVTQRLFYQDYRFGSIFASLKRAPEAELARIAEIPGVVVAESRVREAARLEVRGFDEPIEALLTSLPESGQPMLNRLYLTAGRLPDPDRSGEIVIVESFAEEHGLRPGERIDATIRGRQFQLTISGIGVSPEYIYFIRPGSLFPDHQRYAIAWMGREALAQAADMDGAFNDLTISTRRGAEPEQIIERVDQILQRWGGIGAYTRDDQTSHSYLREEMNQLEGMARIVPLIFLGVATFLLSIVVGRIVRMQRDQIAVLKAFGYANPVIGLHFVGFMLAIVLLGALPGIALGAWMGQALSAFYTEFFRFPELVYRISPQIVISGLLLTLAAALGGTFRALKTAFSLPPAEAMRPEPPTNFRRTPLEAMPLIRHLSQPSRMIVRNLERHPFKALLAIVGIALATAILLTGRFQQDTLNYMIDVQFGFAAREDLTVTLTEPTARQALHELAALPGIAQVEPFRTAPIELIAGHRTHRTAVQGLETGGHLHRIVDRELSPIELPPTGMLLTDWLAEELSVTVGDSIELRLLEKDQPVLQVPIVGLAREFVGVSGYMEITALNRLLGEDQVISGAFVEVDSDALPIVYQELRDRPRVAGSSLRVATIDSFNETMGEVLIVFSLINTILAGIIAFGVIYNTARLALSERGRELASLRVLGFRRREVAQILLGELAILTLAALPLGFAIGYGFCWLIGYSMASEFYRIPTVIHPDSYAFSAVIVLLAALLSAAAIGKRLYNLDLIAVLKTRE
ncbi:MAG: FtsX-like permease family protein [Pseudomonadota bacterium]